MDGSVGEAWTIESKDMARAHGSTSSSLPRFQADAAWKPEHKSAQVTGPQQAPLHLHHHSCYCYLVGVGVGRGESGDKGAVQRQAEQLAF